MRASETLRANQCNDEIDQQQQGDDAPEHGRDHSRSKPRRVNASTANPAMINKR
jgi:hypothetical protein